ncbi:MAG: hypothetical protein LUF82_04490 [Clostridia bacterium]|nr:hypothetical protein [Clostridia bacterium]
MYYFLIALSVIVFIALNAFVFPKVFLRSRSGVAGDRGIKDIAEEDDGRTIIYRPDAKFSRVLKHYILSKRDGKKVVICEVDPALQYIDYDITMFNENGRVIKALNVKEAIRQKGFTKTVEAEEATAYVSVSVNKADGTVFKNSGGGVSPVRVALFALCCAAVTLICAFLIRVSFAGIFGGEMYSLLGNLVTIAASAVVVAAEVALSVRIVNKSAVKAAKGGKHA